LIRKASIDELTKKICNAASSPVRIMEVCGTHTMNIARYGLKQLLPPGIQLISGPGCPVCVTDENDIDLLLEMARFGNVSIFTFGDLYRVPANWGSLEKLKGQGINVRVVFSPLEALLYAVKNPNEEVVFVGIGFETTAPVIAVLLDLSRKKGIKNFSVLSLHKKIPPVLTELVKQDNGFIDGLLLPGHVSSIIGTEPYRALAETWRIPCVITGFEPADILEGIFLILQQILLEDCRIDIQYRRGVNTEGNPLARAYISEYFEDCDALWRGLGLILQSGLAIRKTYRDLDAHYRFNLNKRIDKEGLSDSCSCGDILRGRKTPLECLLFGTVCSPDNPAGPCMVSSQGACAASFYYERKKYEQ